MAGGVVAGASGFRDDANVLGLDAEGDDFALELVAYLLEGTDAGHVFSPGCFGPATAAASMAIDRPGTIGDASGTDRSRAEDAVAKTLLPREEWASAQGKKVESDGVAAQAIEAQPVFGQIKPKRGQALACLEQHPQEKTSRISIAKNKGAQRTDVEKESRGAEKGRL